jgi:hypothetical protein
METGMTQSGLRYVRGGTHGNRISIYYIPDAYGRDNGKVKVETMRFVPGPDMAVEVDVVIECSILELLDGLGITRDQIDAVLE